MVDEDKFRARPVLPAQRLPSSPASARAPGRYSPAHALLRPEARAPLDRKIERIPTTSVSGAHHYDWPGNIRELQNVIERSVILSNGPELRVAMPELRDAPSPLPLYGRTSGISEGYRCVPGYWEAPKEANGQVGGLSGAAARLGLSAQHCSPECENTTSPASTAKAAHRWRTRAGTC